MGFPYDLYQLKIHVWSLRLKSYGDFSLHLECCRLEIERRQFILCFKVYRKF